MKEVAISCAHPSCRCTIANTSPDPYCCEYCMQSAADTKHCECDHDACGGIPQPDFDPRDRIERDVDPRLERKV